MWKTRCIFVRKYYHMIISPCFLETLRSIWWVHSLLMCFFHLQGIPILWKVLNYSNPGYSWAHEARVRTSLEHPLSAERTSGQVVCYMPVCYISPWQAALLLQRFVQEVAPKVLPTPRVESSEPASWAIGPKFFVCMCVNILIQVNLAMLYHCGV